MYTILTGYCKEQEAFLGNKPVAFLLWKVTTRAGAAGTTSILNLPEQLQPSGTKEPRAKVRGEKAVSALHSAHSLCENLLEDFEVHPP